MGCRKWRSKNGRTGTAFVLALSLGCTAGTEDRPNYRLDSLLLLDMAEPLCPLPEAPRVNEAWAALGEVLFKDRALSGDQKVACADCHLDGHGLADETPRSTVEGRRATLLNAPTMYNVVYSFRVTWGGRYESLETHLDDLMKNPDVMASTWATASEHLQNKAGYIEQFQAAFPDGLTPANVRTALVEYERSLVTPDAPFDRFLRGEQDAIGADAKQGYALFKTYGCTSCHQGCGVGGNMLERLGVMRDYFDDQAEKHPADEGLYQKTKNERDRHMFRVPSLRNVARTAPYFHDGSIGTLEGAIQAMARFQLGRDLRPEETRSIAAFLSTLTGRYRGKPI